MAPAVRDQRERGRRVGEGAEAGRAVVGIVPEGRRVIDRRPVRIERILGVPGGRSRELGLSVLTVPLLVLSVVRAEAVLEEAEGGIADEDLGRITCQ